MSRTARRRDLLLRMLGLAAATLAPLTAAGQAFIETQIGGLTRPPGFVCPTPAPPPPAPCPVDSEAYAVAVQPDGMIVAVGRSIYPLPLAPPSVARYAVTVARYDVFGDMDPTFGTGGIVQTTVGGGDSVAHAVAIQPDGKIVVGGGRSDGIIIHGQSVNTSSFLLRYLPNGTLDPSFNAATGAVGVEIDALAIQPDGSIVAVGRSSSIGEFFSLMLARFSSTGAGGSVIGRVGLVIPRFDCPFDCPAGSPLALGPDGSIVLGGGGGGAGGGPTLSRFLANGTPDPSFRFGGFVAGGVISAVAVQPDGKILAGGRSPQNTPQGNQQFTLARYLPSGALDPSFGTGGIVQDPVGIGRLDSFITALTVLADGFIVAGGTAFGSGDTHEFTALGLNTTGRVEYLDQRFYGAGADSFLGTFAVGPDRHQNTVVFAAGPVYGSFLPGHIGVSGPFVFAVEKDLGGLDANTFTGTMVAVSVPPVTATFLGNVTQDGVTSLFTSDVGPTPPTGFQLGTPPVYFYISTTALFMGNIQVCINYSSISFTGTPRLFHEKGGVLIDVTTSVDTVAKKICGMDSSLSPYFPAESSSQDTTPPTTTAAVNPPPNAAGWENSNVTVTLTSTDNEPGGTGVKQITYSASGAQTIVSTVVTGASASFAINTEGITTITFFGTDNAGNVEAANNLTIKLDKTPPTITGSRTPGPNANGWNNTPVTVSFQCSDSLSGLAPGSPPAPTVLSAEGANQSVTGTCMDVAGNSVSATVSGINIDKTPPVVSVAANPATLWPPNGKMVPVMIFGQMTDNLSGIDPATATFAVNDQYGVVQPSGGLTVAPDGSYSFIVLLEARRNGQDNNGRLYTITVSAQDKAGNASSSATTVLVPHDQGH